MEIYFYTPPDYERSLILTQAVKIIIGTSFLVLRWDPKVKLYQGSKLTKANLYLLTFGK